MAYIRTKWYPDTYSLWLQYTWAKKWGGLYGLRIGWKLRGAWMRVIRDVMHSQHPFYSSSPLFCCFIRSHWCSKSRCLLPHCTTLDIINSTTTERLNRAYPNYFLLSILRTHPGNSSSIGGGAGFVVHETFTQLTTPLPNFSLFQSSSVTFQLSRCNIFIYIVYRPHSSFLT